MHNNCGAVYYSFSALITGDWFIIEREIFELVKALRKNLVYTSIDCYALCATRLYAQHSAKYTKSCEWEKNKFAGEETLNKNLLRNLKIVLGIFQNLSYQPLIEKYWNGTQSAEASEQHLLRRPLNSQLQHSTKDHFPTSTLYFS